jgi:hypothetical protein
MKKIGLNFAKEIKSAEIKCFSRITKPRNQSNFKKNRQISEQAFKQVAKTTGGIFCKNYFHIQFVAKFG